MQLCDRHFASQITWKDCKKMLQKHIMSSGKVFAFFDGWFLLQNFIRPDERNFWLIWKIHQWHEVWRNGRLAGQWIFYLRWTIILQWNTTEQIELEQLQWFSNTDKLSESLVCPRFQRGGLTSTRVSGFTWLALHLPVWKAVHEARSLTDVLIFIFRGDPHSLSPELPVLHKLYENYTLAGKNMSRLLDAVFKNYDKRIRPFYEGKKKLFYSRFPSRLLFLTFPE